jgi:hypothetical protein
MQDKSLRNPMHIERTLDNRSGRSEESIGIVRRTRRHLDSSDTRRPPRRAGDRDDRRRSALGEILLTDQALTPEQLSVALNLQQASGRQLARSWSNKACSTPDADPRTGPYWPPTIDLRRRPHGRSAAVIDETIACSTTSNRCDYDGTGGGRRCDHGARTALQHLPVDAVNVYLAPLQDELRRHELPRSARSTPRCRRMRRPAI